MFWRPRKTIRLGPVRINVGKRGVSASAGHGLGLVSTGQIRWSNSRGRATDDQEPVTPAPFLLRVVTTLMILGAIWIAIVGHWYWAGGLFLLAVVIRNSSSNSATSPIATRQPLGFFGVIRWLVAVIVLAIGLAIGSTSYGMFTAKQFGPGGLALAIAIPICLLAAVIRPKRSNARATSGSDDDVPDWINQSDDEDAENEDEEVVTWRALPPTDKQRRFAQQLQIDYPPNITCGELSDLINAKVSRE